MIIETLTTLAPNLIDIRDQFKLGPGWENVPLLRESGEKEIGLRPEGSIRRISVHHSAVEGDIFGHERYHVQTKKYPGVAYHVYLKRERRFLCNHPYALTWHTQSNNYDTLGVCIEGNFTRRNLTDVERENLVGMLYVLMTAFDLSADVVRGHWEWTSKSQTSCPGFDMNPIRSALVNLQNRATFEQSAARKKEMAFQIANQSMYLYNMANGKLPDGKPASEGQINWATNTLMEFYPFLKEKGLVK